MIRLNPIISSAKVPAILFRRSDRILFPELNSPALIILKTGHVRADELEKLGSFLSEKENAKRQRFRFSRDRVSYTVVHGYLRWMLGRYLGVSPETVEINYNSFGKPSVSGYPRHVFFNLSHSSGLSALAFDPENEIGVDVEHMDKKFEFEPIMQLFFTKEEGQYIQHSEAEPWKRFYEIWTRKEAILKALGLGITENLRVEVLNEKIKGNVIMEDGFDCKDFLFRSMIFEQNYRITLALNEHSDNIHAYVIGNNEDGIPMNEL